MLALTILLGSAMVLSVTADDDAIQITEKRIGDNVLVLMGRGGNVTAVKTDEGVLVVDSFTTPRAGAKARKRIEEFSDQPIRYLVNTHHHGDHIWGNQAFADAVIFGHAECEEIVRRTGRDSYEVLKPLLEQEVGDLEQRLQGDLDDAQRERLQRALATSRQDLEEFAGYVFTPPEIRLLGSAQLRLGGVVFEVTVLPAAHTATNLIVYVPDEKLLIAGDVVFTPGFFPFIDHANGGAPGAWVRVLDGLSAKYGEDTIVVPGHGDPAGMELLRAQQQCLQNIIDAVAAARERGLDLEQAQAEIGLEEYGGWQYFEMRANNIEAAWKEMEAGIEIP